MSEKRNSQRARRICREVHEREDHLGRRYMVCGCGCRSIIHPTAHRWRADHFPKRWAEGGRDTPDNLRPILLSCDAGPSGKAAGDTKTVARGKRIDAKRNGWKARRGPPMPGSRDSEWKRKINGQWVRR